MLWVLVLVGFLVAHMTATGRTEVRIARNLYTNAAAEAAIGGAISEAVFRLTDPDPNQAWQLDGSRHELTIGGSRIVLQIADEAARINPNFASPALLEGLLRATGNDAVTAKRLAVAITEWVGIPAGRAQAAAAAQYAAPRQPIESLDELTRVVGMTPNLLAALRPHLTIYGPPVPDPDIADPVVAAALGFVSGQRGGSLQAAAVASRRGGFITARIIATAHGPDNAEVTRVTVIRLDPAKPLRFIVLARQPSLD